jgi:hypothetical protein
MEILFLVLAFLAGALFGAALLFVTLRYLQQKAIKKLVNQMGDDPFSMLMSMTQQLQENSK